MDYLKQNRFKIVKFSLITATILDPIFFIAYWFHIHDEFCQFAKNEFKIYGNNEEKNQQLAEAIFRMPFLLVIPFRVLFVNFIVKENRTAIWIFMAVVAIPPTFLTDQGLLNDKINDIFFYAELFLVYYFSDLIKDKEKMMNELNNDPTGDMDLDNFQETRYDSLKYSIIAVILLNSTFFTPFNNLIYTKISRFYKEELNDFLWLYENDGNNIIVKMEILMLLILMLLLVASVMLMTIRGNTSILLNTIYLTVGFKLITKDFQISPTFLVIILVIFEMLFVFLQNFGIFIEA